MNGDFWVIEACPRAGTAPSYYHKASDRDFTYEDILEAECFDLCSLRQHERIGDELKWRGVDLGLSGV